LGRVVEIVDGAQLNVTSARYRTPSGRWPGDASENRFGILPDIEVKQEPFYVPLSAADKQFRKALETVEAMAKSNH
jgi:C-terminal processing protease CtpA/Prc